MGRAQLPAVLRELHLPMAAMCCSPAERRGQGMHRETPSSGAAHQHAKHKPKNQARPRNGHFLPMDILEGRVCSSSSAPKAMLAAGGSQAGHHSHASTTAQGSSPQFMLLNTWLMREHQSLECWPSPCQFWHFSHQSTRNKSHLLPCWFKGITKLPCAGGSQPCWHSQGTVKSPAGSKTAQSQEDREYQTLGSGSSCQHLLKHQLSSTSPTKPLVVVHPLTELVSSGLKPGNY